MVMSCAYFGGKAFPYYNFSCCAPDIVAVETILNVFSYYVVLCNDHIPANKWMPYLFSQSHGLKTKVTFKYKNYWRMSLSLWMWDKKNEIRWFSCNNCMCIIEWGKGFTSNIKFTIKRLKPVFFLEMWKARAKKLVLVLWLYILYS